VSGRDRTEDRRGEPEDEARPAAEPARDGVAAADQGADAEHGDGAAPSPASETEADASGDSEPGAVTVDEADAPGKDVKDPLARAEEERAEYLALAQRTKADFENYRRRAAREVASAGVRERADVVRELLPVVDNLERALESADDSEGPLAQGVRLVHSELAAVLARNGVEAIDPGGEPFDPTVHEALSTRSENGTEAGVVLDVVQRGYRLDETVLRPARVVVSA
jgi:molecular chaperone GrpE